MIPPAWALLGAAIGSAGGLVYLVDTLRGRARPNRATWLLWGLFPLVIFAAQRAQGVAEVSWTTASAGLLPLLVVAASFAQPRAYWRSDGRDLLLMGAAVAGMVLWAVTDQPNLALVFALAADILASLPTLLKAWRHPETESAAAYGVSAAGFAISLAAVPEHSLEATAFVAYIFLLNAGLALLALRRRA
jgi:hypothetical protein